VVAWKGSILDVGELKLPEAMLEFRGPAKAGDSEGVVVGRVENSAAGLAGSILPGGDKIKRTKEGLESSHNDGCLWLCG
jgi:hypothetical protein